MLKQIGKSIVGLILLVSFIIKLPEWHYSYIRSYVAQKVVKITNEAGTSGGTGVHVKTPHGQVVILTNAHVCGLGKDGIVYVSNDAGITIPRRIIQISKVSDLCVVEAIAGTPGLSIGSEAQIGDIVAVIGHPRLMPTTVSRGEIISEEIVQVGDHEMNPLDPNDKCDLPKQKIIHFKAFFGDIDVCILELKAYLSNVVILPGNSGSPVVNKWGNIVALVFAGNSDSMWGIFITLHDIVECLKPY